MHYNAVIAEHEPYKRLIAAVILQAVHDARFIPAEYNSPSLAAEIEEAAEDAIQFLFTDRLNIYCEMLEIDPDAFRESLIKEQNKRCDDCRITSFERSRENRYRYNFRINYERYGKNISA